VDSITEETLAANTENFSLCQVMVLITNWKYFKVPIPLVSSFNNVYY
jgi:hypothetical protein